MPRRKKEETILRAYRLPTALVKELERFADAERKRLALLNYTESDAVRTLLRRALDAEGKGR